MTEYREPCKVSGLCATSVELMLTLKERTPETILTYKGEAFRVVSSGVLRQGSWYVNTVKVADSIVEQA